MGTPLLATKLFVPPARPGLVLRPRLMERVNQAFSNALTIVSAQAGSGKTTLLAQWISQSKVPGGVAWVSLDQSDNDPVIFWDYFIASLKAIEPDAGDEAANMLHSSSPAPAESILTSLINDLAGLSHDFVLVLDDYHVIQTEAIHSGIAFFVDHIPPRMHLVIASRTGPALPLARFRGKGLMLEIGSEALRFTLEEAEDLLKASGASLSEEHVNALHARTEGWAVGLRMAALSIRWRLDVGAFIESFTGSNRLVMDYLLQEVLRGQPRELQDFLLTTSVLERLTAPLCDHITGATKSQFLLMKLEQSNLFVIPLDDSRRWYRYHQLLAELLRQQLETTRGRRELEALHKRASQWYENAGLFDDAIHHALAAKDWERSMSLIFDQAETRLKRGEWDTLVTWLRGVPDNVLCTHKRLYCRYANALMARGQMETAEPVLSYLERTCGEDAELQGEVAFFQTILARRNGDIPKTIEMARRALDLLPADNLSMRARVTFNLGTCQMDKDHLEEAQRLVNEAYEMGRLAGDSSIVVGAKSHLGYILWLRGRLREALEMDQRAIEMAGETPLAAAPASGECLILYEQNSLDQAGKCALRALEASGLEGQSGARRRARYCRVMTSLARGDLTGAAGEIEKADQAASHPAMPSSYHALHAAERVIFAIRQNDVQAALKWGETLPQFPDGITDVWLQYVPARLLIAEGKKVIAAERLEGLYQKASRAGAQSIVILIRTCQALAASTPSEALSFLSDALRLGQPEGFVRTFVDEGRLLAPVLREAVSSGIVPEYSAMLLRTIEQEERQRVEPIDGSLSFAPKSSPLSSRELEILHMVAAGLSNGQIAERLIISLGTAKTHIHNIYEKLGAKDRLDAVNKARAMKLI